MQVAVSNPRLVQNVNHEDDENYFVSLYGAERVAEQKIAPTSSNVSGGTTTFSFQPPSTGTIMDKCVLLQVEVSVTNATDALSTRLTPRAWPLNNAIQTLQVTINGTTITSSPNQRKAFMERLHTSKELRRRFTSYTPTFRDNDYDYDTMASQREAYNPFARKKILSHELSRYEFPNEETPWSNGVRLLNNKYVFTEPLFIDVFELTKIEGIHNINKIDITINWMPNILAAMFGDARVLNAATTANAPNTIAQADSVTAVATSYGTANGAVFSAQFTANKQFLLVRYVTPSSVPKELLTLPYTEFTRYNKIGTALAPPAVGPPVVTGLQEITFDAIRETMVPKYMILLVKRREASDNVLLADTMFNIESVNIQVDNMQGILSTATPQQLWQMSARNGLDVSWNEWYYQGQCIVVIEFGENIGGLIPNVVGQFNMLITITVKNNFRFTYTPEAEVFLSKDGFLEITPNDMRVKLGIMRQDVEQGLANENLQALDENDDRVGEAMEGAGFKKGFRKFRKFASGVGKGANAVLGPATKLAGLAVLGKTLAGGGQMRN